MPGCGAARRCWIPPPTTGSVGPAVNWLWLRLLPQSASADAAYDTTLRDAVRNFQNARGLPTDGVADPGDPDGAGQWPARPALCAHWIEPMSLILEALRKSEAERRRDSTPDVALELPPPRPAPAWHAHTWLWPVLLCTAALLALGVWLSTRMAVRMTIPLRPRHPSPHVRRQLQKRQRHLPSLPWESAHCARARSGPGPGRTHTGTRNNACGIHGPPRRVILPPPPPVNLGTLACPTSTRPHRTTVANVTPPISETPACRRSN